MRRQVNQVSLAFLCLLGLVCLCLSLSGCGRGHSRPAVRGSVLDPLGRPVTDVMVTFLTPNNPLGFSAYVDPTTDGYFHLTCPPGKYKVTVAPKAMANRMPGDLPEPVKEDSSKTTVAEIYWKAELTPLSATIPEKGINDLKLQLSAQYK
jgi:Carboxypeptidase regulatory-like domain